MHHLLPLPDNDYEFESRRWSDSFLATVFNPWLNYLLPAKLLKWAVRRSKSPIVHESFRRPGGWLSTYQAYENAEPVDLVDRIALTDPIARALRNRRQVVTRLLTDFIRHYSANGPVRLVGVGAGPGAQFQDAILRSGVDTASTQAHIIDLHDDAFPFGTARAQKLGLGDAVTYQQGDARNAEELLPDVHPQIVKLIGIIEYLSDEQVLSLLKPLRRMMTDDAVVLTNSFSDRFNGSRFLVRVFGLKHYYRSAADVRRLLREAGFAVPEEFASPMEMYSIMWAKPAA